MSSDVLRLSEKIYRARGLKWPFDQPTKGSTMNYATQTAATNPPALPVHAAHDELDNMIAQLHEVISTLAARLNLVLGSPKPQSVEGAAKGPQAVPTIANRIYSQASAVRAARERVGDLLDRLEV